MALIFCSARPGNSNQKRALADRFDIVRNSVLKGEKAARFHGYALFRNLDSNLSLQQLNRNAAVDVVLAELRVGLHENKDNVQIRVFDQRSRATAAVSAPRFPALKTSDFTGKVKSKECTSQCW